MNNTNRFARALLALLAAIVLPQAALAEFAGWQRQYTPEQAASAAHSALATQGLDRYEFSSQDETKSVSNGLYIEGNFSYETSGSTATMRADRIRNDSSTRTTGTLRLELWATSSRPARGAAFSGYKLATGNTLSPLAPRSYYSDVVRSASYSAPPSGTYWMVLVLSEFDSVACPSSDRFCIEDTGVFSTQQCFGTACTVTPPPPPAATTVTAYSSTGNQCYENYSQAAFNILQSSSPGLFTSYPSSTSCASLGMSFYVGTLLGEANVRVYTTNSASAQILCSTGLVTGCTVAPPPPPATTTSSLENPASGSYQSGIGLISGWSCQSGTFTARVGSITMPLSYGSPRADTASLCGSGNTNTGFGLLFNYNILGAGTHTIQLLRNGVAVGNPATFTVTVPSGEFMTGVTREVSVPNFPTSGRTATLIWQQGMQNFSIKSVVP